MTKKKVEKRYACNGCGFETVVVSEGPCPGCGHDTEPVYSEIVEEDQAEEAGPKTHRHSYRKDGTCACGQVRKVRKPR